MLLHLKEHRSGGTALHLAALHGHEEVVRLLIEVGGKDLVSESADNGVPAWVAANVGGHVGIERLLLEAIGVSEPLSEKRLNR